MNNLNDPTKPSQIVAEVDFPDFITELGNIPSSYQDSMSFYEIVAWLCQYIEETVIPTVNENGEAVEELQGLYIELKSFVLEHIKEIEGEIPTKLSQLENDTGFITKAVTDLENYYNKTQSDNKYFVKENIVTTVSGSSTDSEVPSAKLFYDTVGDISTILQILDTGSGV